MAAIQDRASPVAFYPSAEEIHERVGELGWCDAEVYSFVGENLANVPQPSMRHYHQGMKLRDANMKWRQKLLRLWA